MTDRDGRNEDSKTCQTRIITRDSSLGRNLLSSNLNQNQSEPPTITNTDSEGDYETSSEGPQSPRPDFQRSQTSFGRNVAPKSDESIFVNSTLFRGEDPNPQLRNNASYTIIGVSDLARTQETPGILDHVDQTSSGNSISEIKMPSWGVEELEARRTEYFVGSRIENEVIKSESLPVITIATPWGSYEYPDVHMPAERLLSDSPVDIKAKMRLIAECMDGSGSRTISRAKLFDCGNESSRFLHGNSVPEDEVKLHRNSEIEEVENIRACSGPTTPRTPKMISVTSPKIFSEPFNILPIIRNPDIESDYTAPPSPSGSSVPMTLNNNASSIRSSSFYYHRESESLRNLASKKNSYDPLSRIEGELGPLQNELSEIRGKVRALNLDYNLSCINGISRIQKPINWMAGNQSSNHLQIRPVKDDFILGAFDPTSAIKLPNFQGPNQPSHRYHFPNRSSAAPIFYGLEEAGDKFATADLSVASESFNRSDDFQAQVSSFRNSVPEVASTTDRNLSPVYICTSTPSSLHPEIDVESGEDGEPESPEIRLPDFWDKISIVPIAYVDGMPDPPAEPVFNFAQSEEDDVFEAGYKVLRIEHPDASFRRREFGSVEIAKTSSSLSETILTPDNSETETSIAASLRKFQDDSSNENSARPSDRIIISKLGKKNSCSQFTAYTSQESPGKTYIRGLISGPEDFL